MSVRRVRFSWVDLTFLSKHDGNHVVAVRLELSNQLEDEEE